MPSNLHHYRRDVWSGRREQRTLSTGKVYRVWNGEQTCALALPPTICFCRQTARARARHYYATIPTGRAKMPTTPCPPRANPSGLAFRRRPIKTVSLAPSHPPSPSTTVRDFAAIIVGGVRKPVPWLAWLQSGRRQHDSLMACLAIIVCKYYNILSARQSLHRRRRRDLVCARALTHAHVRLPPWDPFTSNQPPPPSSFSLVIKNARVGSDRPPIAQNHSDGRLARRATKNNALPDYYCTQCATVPLAIPLVRALLTRSRQKRVSP